MDAGLMMIIISMVIIILLVSITGEIYHLAKSAKMLGLAGIIASEITSASLHGQIRATGPEWNAYMKALNVVVAKGKDRSLTEADVLKLREAADKLLEGGEKGK